MINPERSVAVIAASLGLGGFLVMWSMAFSAEDHDDHSDHSGHDDHSDHQDEKEGIEIPEDIQELVGLKMAVAGPHKFSATIRLNGRVHTNRERLASVRARYPGVVLETRSELGDKVRAGQTLAFVEANGSLSRFPVKAGISGIVMEKNIVPGQFVNEHKDLYKVVDLKGVWVDLLIPDTYTDSVKKGQMVWLTLDGDAQKEVGQISYVSPMVHADSQTRFARVVLDNRKGRMLPGDFVEAEVKVADVDASLAVNLDAVQTINDRPVVFVQTESSRFIPRKVTLGTRGQRLVAVTAGLQAGEKYVAKNSYTMKAELMKAAAGHDHGH